MSESYTYRLKPLPEGELKGIFLVTHDVLLRTKQVLVDYALAGIDDGGHEGLVYWAGREMGETTAFLAAVAPDADHSAQRVQASKQAIAKAARACRAVRLGMLCQVHSHPGQGTYHSDGDDEMVLLPFEGMLSLVAPKYGITLENLSDFGVHQFQKGTWVHCSRQSVQNNLIVVPSLLDLR